MMAKPAPKKSLHRGWKKHKSRALTSLPVSRSCWGGGSDIAEEIVEQAAALHADLLVMGTHGRTGLMHLMLGSVAESVMKKSATPLLIVRSNKKQTNPPVLPNKKRAQRIGLFFSMIKTLTLANLAVAQHHPFLARQTLQPDGTTGMDFIG